MLEKLSMQFNKPTDLLYTNNQTIVTALGEFLTTADDERENIDKEET